MKKKMGIVLCAICMMTALFSFGIVYAEDEETESPQEPAVVETYADPGEETVVVENQEDLHAAIDQANALGAAAIEAGVEMKQMTIELRSDIQFDNSNQKNVFELTAGSNVRIEGNGHIIAPSQTFIDNVQGGRKPYRQKGTGRARQGSIRAAQWRGGGTVFGPKPRNYGYRLNRKVRRLALKSVLSEKVNESAMSVLDKFAIDAPKTKTFNQILAAINAPKKTLFVVSEKEDYMNAMLSMRNIPTMMMLTAERINVFDIMNANQIVFTEAAVRDVEEALG